MRLRPIALTLVLALSLYSPCAYTQEEKESYAEDVVEAGGKLYKVEVDPDTERVIYYWNDEKAKWDDASGCPADLNKAYSEKMTLKDIQDEMDMLKDERWDDRYHGNRI